MEKIWKKIYFSGNDFRVRLAHDLLEGNGVNSVVVNKKDSSYLNFGDAELYVEEQDEQEALLLLDQLIKETI